MADTRFVKSRICTEKILDKLYLFLFIFSLDTVMMLLFFARFTGRASWFSLYINITVKIYSRLLDLCHK